MTTKIQVSFGHLFSSEIALRFNDKFHIQTKKSKSELNTVTLHIYIQ